MKTIESWANYVAERRETQWAGRQDALLGNTLDHFWTRQGEGRPDLSLAEWCRAWRRADRRPTLDGPVRLYRGGYSPVSLTWTDSPALALALAFANHHASTTQDFYDVLGEFRLPLWTMEFPPDAILRLLPRSGPSLSTSWTSSGSQQMRLGTTSQQLRMWPHIIALGSDVSAAAPDQRHYRLGSMNGDRLDGGKAAFIVLAEEYVVASETERHGIAEQLQPLRRGGCPDEMPEDLSDRWR